MAGITIGEIFTVPRTPKGFYLMIPFSPSISRLSFRVIMSGLALSLVLVFLYYWGKTDGFVPVDFEDIDMDASETRMAGRFGFESNSLATSWELPFFFNSSDRKSTPQ